MSVTFSPVIVNSRVRLSCVCKATKSTEIFETTKAADEFKTAVGFTPVPCVDEFCNTLPRFIEEMTFAPELNMSNVNARFVLEALGYIAEDLTGSASADDFAGRVLLSLAISPLDEGVPAYDDSSYDSNGTRTSMQLVQMGRSANYLQDKLEELREVAAWATAHKTTITWG